MLRYDTPDTVDWALKMLSVSVCLSSSLSRYYSHRRCCYVLACKLAWTYCKKRQHLKIFIFGYLSSLPLPLSLSLSFSLSPYSAAPQWGTADAKNSVPSFENPEFKGSPFKACSRSILSHACYPYYQEFLPC